MSVKGKIEDVYQHVQNGTALDAFEKYYADNVTMILEDGTAVEGKDANRKRENEFFDSVESFNGMEVVGITANEETEQTAVESWMDVTFKGGNRMKLEQVATQDWEDGKIVRERFYGTQQN
ncbi:SnoaL-like domain-containing protein [Rhodohalobacter sp.]|uniref:SnoaL-like domain-containing protein n=1 Tax=Rhodohalobacter sp. TaxID=1974210 RepID=UPI0035621066